MKINPPKAVAVVKNSLVLSFMPIVANVMAEVLLQINWYHSDVGERNFLMFSDERVLGWLSRLEVWASRVRTPTRTWYFLSVPSTMYGISSLATWKTILHLKYSRSQLVLHKAGIANISLLMKIKKPQRLPEAMNNSSAQVRLGSRKWNFLTGKARAQRGCNRTNRS